MNRSNRDYALAFLAGCLRELKNQQPVFEAVPVLDNRKHC